jgi:hypothetical protein
VPTGGSSYYLSIVHFQAGLLSQNAHDVQVLTRILRSLDVEVEHWREAQDAITRLTQRQFGAIIVDDDQEGAALVLESARKLPSCKSALGIMLGRRQTSNRVGSKNAHIVFYKPISIERVTHGLRAVRTLMARERRGGEKRIPVEIPANLACERIRNIPVLIVDLSDGGAAIRCRQQLPTSGLLTLNCLLPHTGSPIQATAEVVWQDANSQFGVRFVDVPLAARQILHEWLKTVSRSERMKGKSKASAASGTQ